jgi:hypothetical protein
MVATAATPTRMIASRQWPARIVVGCTSNAMGPKASTGPPVRLNLRPPPATRHTRSRLRAHLHANPCDFFHALNDSDAAFRAAEQWALEAVTAVDFVHLMRKS